MAVSVSKGEVSDWSGKRLCLISVVYNRKNLMASLAAAPPMVGGITGFWNGSVGREGWLTPHRPLCRIPSASLYSVGPRNTAWEHKPQHSRKGPGEPRNGVRTARTLVCDTETAQQDENNRLWGEDWQPARSRRIRSLRTRHLFWKTLFKAACV